MSACGLGGLRLVQLALDQQLKLQYDSVIAALDYEGRAALAVSTGYALVSCRTFTIEEGCALRVKLRLRTTGGTVTNGSASIGTPQGGTVSPILANIYLHELDEWLQQKANAFNRGKERARNPVYKILYNRFLYTLKCAQKLKFLSVKLKKV